MAKTATVIPVAKELHRKLHAHLEAIGRPATGRDGWLTDLVNEIVQEYLASPACKVKELEYQINHLKLNLQIRRDKSS